MSDQYIGEVRLVGFNYAPIDWAICNGAVQSISGNETLFSLIGTTYGGDGQSTFNLPNLQGRIPIHQGTNSFGTTYVIGQPGGVENVTLNISQYPHHNHVLAASTNTTGSNNPNNNVVNNGLTAYTADTPASAMLSAMVGQSGGNVQHNNLQPYLALNWIIALYGIYPSQN
ncbi:MAG: tail fiber protein [Terracidiphilus sp.]|jgi:microcystin-dependent protein